MNNDTKIIPPFRGWVLENFPFIEADFDAITNYQLISKVIEYLNKVISSENEQNIAIEDLYNKFIQLKNYVDNLDLQDEVNNKLDEMAESGELDQIIEQYLSSSAIWGFDTVAEMKEATNLINGSYAKTLGYYSKNDGGESTYKIRNITNNDVVDEATIISLNDENLIAELIIKDNTVNVKQFGAYGDNTHDDLSAFQKIINYIKGKYLTLYINEGTYYISQKLDVNWNNSNYWTKFDGSYKIIGSGQFTTILRFGSSNGIDTTHTGILAIEMGDFSIENSEYDAIEDEGNARKPTDSKGIGLLLYHTGYVSKIYNIGVSGFYIGIATRGCYGGPDMINLFTKNCVFGYSSKSDTTTMISNSSFFGFESCYIQEGSMSDLTNIICEGNFDYFKYDNDNNQRTKFKGRGFSFYGASCNLIGCYTERLFGNGRYYEGINNINEIGGILQGGNLLHFHTVSDELTTWLTNNPDYQYPSIECYMSTNEQLQKNSVYIKNPKVLGSGVKVYTNQTVADDRYANFVYDAINSYQGIDNTLNGFYIGNLKPLVYVRTTSAPYKTSNFEILSRDMIGSLKVTTIADKTNYNGPSILTTTRKATFTDTSYDETRLRLIQMLNGGAEIYLEKYLEGTLVTSTKIIVISATGQVTFPQNN